MHDILWKMTQVDQYTITVVLALVAVVFSLIRVMFDSFTLAVVFTPILLFGGLAANYLFRVYYISATTDKDTEVVIASAVGILAAMVLMMIAVWMSILMSDYRWRHRKPEALASQTPVQTATESTDAAE